MLLLGTAMKKGLRLKRLKIPQPWRGTLDA
jgi:hypothetical protein